MPSSTSMFDKHSVYTSKNTKSQMASPAYLHTAMSVGFSCKEKIKHAIQVKR